MSEIKQKKTLKYEVGTHRSPKKKRHMCSQNKRYNCDNTVPWPEQAVVFRLQLSQKPCFQRIAQNSTVVSTEFVILSYLDSVSKLLASSKF